MVFLKMLEQENSWNVHLDINDHKKIKDLIDEKNIDLIVVELENPLVEGIGLFRIPKY